MKKVREVEETRKYYEKKFSSWISRKTDPFYHEAQFTKIVSLWPNKASIVDIGCANGTSVPLFLGIGRNLKYYGIDISKQLLKIARRRYPQLTFAEGNIADNSTLPKKKFDGFIAAAVLMHIPFSHWNEMFSGIEKMTKTNSYGYVVLPVVYPGKEPNSSDTRHFTILSEEEQRAYFKSRNWKVKYSGIDTLTTESVWRWYIVQLP